MEDDSTLIRAAQALHADYSSDKELTAFTVLDGDPFQSNANTEAMEDLAIGLLEGGKLRRAERILKRLLANDPNSLAAHFNLARVYWRTEEYELALFHGHRTLKLILGKPMCA